jgi:hypothetical protein
VRRKLCGLALAAIMAGASLPGGASAAHAQTSGGSDVQIGAIGQTRDKSHRCIDATKASNLRVQWHGTNKVTIRTRGGMPACAETKVIFSAYVVPDMWDGMGFNETAFPQQVYKSTPAVAVSKHKVTLELDAMIPCKNAQYDVYYAPKITRLRWPEAHGAQFISARFRHFG